MDFQVSRNYIVENSSQTLSLEDHRVLIHLVSFEEVHSAIMSMHLFKAPGVDGFQDFSISNTRI